MIWKQGCQAPARYCGSYVTSPVLVPDPKLTFPSKGESVKRDIAEIQAGTRTLAEMARKAWILGRRSLAK